LLRRRALWVSPRICHPERRIDATLPIPSELTPPASEPATKPDKSRPGALAGCFRKSRDLWKAKSQDLKASFQRLTNRVADLTKSRDQWRLKAEPAQDQLAALEAQVVGLQAEVAARAAEKKRTERATP
jgi:outer membrane murein-binding lipoprotein Lpp